MIYDNVDCGYDGHCVNSTEKIKILCLCTSVTSYLFSTQNLIECFSNGPSGVCTIPHIQGLALRRPVIEHSNDSKNTKAITFKKCGDFENDSNGDG